MLCAVQCGCGSGGPELAEVTGTVTLDGNPVPNATVIFNPTTEGGTNSMGKTDAQGNYRLEFTQDKKGALIGEHTVQITTKKISASDMPDTGEVVETKFVAIPPQYRKAGALKAEVKKQRNQIDFALTSK